MNTKSNSPFANPKVREAMRYAVNVSKLISGQLQGNAVAIQSIIPKGLLGYNPSTPYNYDPNRARRLLAEAGYPNGLEFELLSSNESCGGIRCGELAGELQADMVLAGFRANLNANSEALKTYRSQSHQVFLGAWGPDFPDPDANATPFADHNAKSLAWRNAWNNPVASTLANDAALEPNPTERVKLYKQLNELVLRDGPFVLLYQPLNSVVMSSKVQGYQRNVMGQVWFETISKAW